MEAVVKQLPKAIEQHAEGQHALLLAALRGIKQWLEKEIVHQLDKDDNLRRLFIESRMEAGTIFADGIEADAVRFDAGVSVTIAPGARRVRLVQ